MNSDDAKNLVIRAMTAIELGSEREGEELTVELHRLGEDELIDVLGLALNMGVMSTELYARELHRSLGRDVEGASEEVVREWTLECLRQVALRLVRDEPPEG